MQSTGRWRSARQGDIQFVFRKTASQIGFLSISQRFFVSGSQRFLNAIGFLSICLALIRRDFTNSLESCYHLAGFAEVASIPSPKRRFIRSTIQLGKRLGFERFEVVNGGRGG